MTKIFKPLKFNVRAYCLIIDDNNDLIVSDEEYNDVKMTKFPGGGVELGEGIVEALQREAIEEFGQEIEMISHYYTADFFIQSAFGDSQVIPIFYKAKFKAPIKFKISNIPFDFQGEIKQSFRKLNLANISPEVFNFKADQAVVQMIINDFKKQK